MTLVRATITACTHAHQPNFNHSFHMMLATTARTISSRCNASVTSLRRCALRSLSIQGGGALADQCDLNIVSR